MAHVPEHWRKSGVSPSSTWRLAPGGEGGVRDCHAVHGGEADKKACEEQVPRSDADVEAQPQPLHSTPSTLLPLPPPPAPLSLPSPCPPPAPPEYVSWRSIAASALAAFPPPSPATARDIELSLARAPFPSARPRPYELFEHSMHILRSVGDAPRSCKMLTDYAEAHVWPRVQACAKFRCGRGCTVWAQSHNPPTALSSSEEEASEETGQRGGRGGGCEGCEAEAWILVTSALANSFPARMVREEWEGRNLPRGGPKAMLTVAPAV